MIEIGMYVAAATAPFAAIIGVVLFVRRSQVSISTVIMPVVARETVSNPS